MVVQVSPAVKNVGETLCSLNFAQRVRMVELGLASKKIENAAEQKVSDNKIFMGSIMIILFSQTVKISVLGIIQHA